MMRRTLVLLGGLLALSTVSAADPALPPRKILFLGDNGHHNPAERYRQLAPVLAARGIDMTYTDAVASLNPETLGKYDGVVVYANHTRWTAEQEKALLEYVEGGKGFIPLHCASACWPNSEKYIALVGAKFDSHKTGTFSVSRVGKHDILKDLDTFTSWDETYVHSKHNTEGRTVLEERVEKGKREPWTWVRTQGKGRVFYTAWGHDERTWGQPGFQALVERGIRWAVGDDPTKCEPYFDRPKMVGPSPDAPKPEYVEAKVPFYAPGGRGSGEPLTKMPLPMPVEKSELHMQLPADLEAQLFVSEADLPGKPIAMTWDHRGRLWVAVTVDYPNELQRDGKGHDKIIICEDTKGAGKADKFTVFADKLSIPTSLCFARGGVIVTSVPNTLFLRDNDGDDVADERTVLFSGWGTRDTHAGPSNLRNGFDGWIYGIVGYSGFNGTVGGVRHQFGQGIYRFKPDGSQLEFLRSTSNNSWGLGFSEEGYLFGSTANGCASVYLPIPNRYYEAVRGWSASQLSSILGSNRIHPITDKIRQVDFHGGFTAAAGHALYTARTYDRIYWNRTSFVSEPTGHLTATLQLQPVGTDFVARYGWNLIASTDEWTAPIVAEVGPDGNVWVIDWYAYIVQHNPTPTGFRTGQGNAYETPLRDKKHGRIYRLVKKNAPARKPIDLKDATPERLVAALREDNMLWRMHAQRLLVERGKPDVKEALFAEVARTTLDDIGLTPGAIHALWALQGLNLLDSPEGLAALKGALKHPSAAVRRVAALVTPRTAAGADLLRVSLPDETNPQVVMARLLALAEIKDAPPAIGAELKALAMNADVLADRWLPDALTAAAARHDVAFLRAIAQETKPLETKALKIVSITAEHYARGGPLDTAGGLVASLGGAHSATREAVLAGLEKGWPRGAKSKLTEADEKAIVVLLPTLGSAGQGRHIRLMETWGSKALVKNSAEVAKTLLAVAEDPKADEEARVNAARQVLDLAGKEADTRNRLLELVSPRTPPKVAEGILDALGVIADKEMAATFLERYSGWSPALRAVALRTLLGRTATTKAVLVALDKGTIQLDELTLDQRQALTTHPDKDVVEQAKKLLARGGALPNADRVKVIEDRLALTKKTGDADKGKEVFKKNCASCHRHGSEGQNIGPDLTGMAVHPKEELIVHILDPNRSVEGNYRVFLAEMLDGRVVTGMVASETRTSVEIVDANAKRFTLQRADIERLTGTNRSLMPEGFEKQLGDEGLVDLLEFLTKKGKYLPLPLEKVATIVSTKGMFYSDTAEQERLVFTDWKPKMVGEVPFTLIDPQGDRVKNAVLLYSNQGKIPPTMPKSVKVPCNTPAKAIHLLGGVGGWAYPYSQEKTVSMIVRLHYADGSTEDHELKNGVHIADYIRKVDVPESKYAFAARGQQVRYLSVTPKKTGTIKEIELVKGPDNTAPVVLALTVETGN
jgi:putative membrane-bound dehydrogenase-like protein